MTDTPSPPLKSVYSSHISQIGYDPVAKELTVCYSKGRAAVYREVPADVGESIMQAPSVGEALHNLVRGKFSFTYKDSESNA